MRIAYFAECMLPGQDGVLRVLSQAATHLRGQGYVICWITAVPEPDLPEAQLLTRGIPVPGYVPYRVSIRPRNPGGDGLGPGLSSGRCRRLGRPSGAAR